MQKNYEREACFLFDDVSAGAEPSAGGAGFFPLDAGPGPRM
jgi:hypothetical protein